MPHCIVAPWVQFQVVIQQNSTEGLGDDRLVQGSVPYIYFHAIDAYKEF